MKRYLIPIIAISTILFVSCTKVIDFEEADTEQQIVVNGILSPDSTFVVMLTKSRSILEEAKYQVVADAQVILFEDGTEIGQAYEDRGYYVIPTFTPQSGKSYRLNIKANGKELNAETAVPVPVEVTKTDTTTIENEWGGKTMELKVTFQDSPENDYYRIIVFREQLLSARNEHGATVYYRFRQPDYINLDDPVFKSLYSNFEYGDVETGPDNDYAIFSDELINGKEYTLRFEANFSSSNGNYGMIYEKYIVHFQKLSGDLFNHLKYVNLYDYYHDDPFSEPVPVYSNIKNGAGIFAGFNDDQKLVFEEIHQPYSMDTIQVEEGYGYGGYYYGY